MRKGFSYVQLIVYITLLAIIITPVSQTIYKIIRQALRHHYLIQQKQELTTILDDLRLSCQYAENIDYTPDTITYTDSAGTYLYKINDHRLIRQKDGILYLTPKTYTIEKFQVQKNSQNIYQITLSTKDQNFVYLIRRRI